MWKRISLLICCLMMIAGCNSAEQPEHDLSIAKKAKEPSALQLRMLYFGDGNDQGFYHLVQNEQTANTSVMYYDYASRKELYLCDKPECKHSDESCNAFLGMPGIYNLLFLHGTHLYYIASDGGISFGESGRKASTTKLYRMDLNGKNHIKLCDMPEGYIYNENRIMMDDMYVYLQMDKKQDVKLSESQSLQHVNARHLFRIQMETGEVQDVMNCKNKDIIGVEGRALILGVNHFSKDPDKLLNEKKYDEYNAVTANVHLTYQSYDLDKKKAFDDIDITNTSEQCTYANQKLYYMNDKELHAVSLKDGSDEKVAVMKSGLIYSIMNVWNGKLMIEAWENGSAENTYATSYTFDTTKNELREQKQHMREPKQAVQIYGETKDSFFVHYDHVQHLEKTWAGTDQYTMDKVYFGMIKKDDFWNNKQTYERFDTISMNNVIKGSEDAGN